MARIRLAYLVDSMEVGGSELNAIRTLEQLDRARFELSVIHLGAEGPLTPRYQALGIPRTQLSFRSFKHPSALGAGLRLRRVLKRDRVQILHSHDIYSNIFGVPWARLARTPVIIVSKRWQFSVPSRQHLLVNRLAMRWATNALANSQVVARTLVEEEGVRAGRIQVIPNFVGDDAFVPYSPVERARLLEGLKLPPDAFVIGVVARLSPVKDHRTLLQAFARLSSAHPRVHALLIGEGPCRAALEAQAQELRLTDRVHFAGRLSSSPNPHGLLDISVLPSSSEGFPNAVVEAMAAGKPVVATDVGGVREAVVDGEVGKLVPPGDPVALAAGLEALLSNPALAKACGERGRERARRLYYVDSVLGKLMEWYASLLPGASPR